MTDSISPDFPTDDEQTGAMLYHLPYTTETGTETGTRPEAGVRESASQSAAAYRSDEARVWVPLADGISFRPLHFSALTGEWSTLLRIRKSGLLSRHRHALPLHAWVVKGRWQYLESDWVAEEGSYVFEAPGETHTLVIPEGTGEVVTYVHTQGAVSYVDALGEATGYDDAFTRIKAARTHYEAVGLGADYVDRFIR